MGSSEQVRRLVESSSPGDDRSFRRATAKAVSEARSGKKDTIADELEALMGPKRSETNSSLTFASLRPLPASQDDVPLLNLHRPSVSLDELILAPKLRELVNEIVAEHKSRQRLSAYGLWPRTRLLFVGASGTGKSRTAEGIADSLGVPLARVRLAAVVSSYLGETSRNLDRIFNFVNEGQVVLVFDEVDMLGSEREFSDHGEMRRVVAAFLQALEEHRSDNLVIATTNHSGVLDDALWRRFDEIGHFGLPNQEQIQQLLTVKLRRMKTKVNRETVAKSLKGFNQADIETVCLNAMRTTVMSGRSVVSTADLVESAGLRHSRLKGAGRSASQGVKGKD